jgi:hypothetical protein
VILLDPGFGRLYVAIGDPGLLEVIDVASQRRLELVATERGAKTFGLDPTEHRLFVFCPASHRAAVYRDAG